MRWLPGLLTLAALAPTAAAQGVARTDAPKGAVVTRDQTGTFALLEGQQVPAGPLLLLDPGVALTDPDGKVRLVSRPDFVGLSELPVLETAVSLQQPNGVAALDVTLDRGRVEFQAGDAVPVSVRVRFARQDWLLTLVKPKSRVAVEVVGRWPAGAEFRFLPEPGFEPTVTAAVTALAGSVTVGTGRTTVSLDAPPGPAILRWNSADGREPAPERLDRLPTWADPTAALPPALAATAGKMNLIVSTLPSLRVKEGSRAVETLLNSKDTAARRLGLILCGATDDLERLTQEAGGTSDRDTWDFGVTVLRHWLGRGPGQQQKLYQYLTDARGFTPTEGATVVRLLNGFTAESRTKPELYDVLIEYLRHDKVALRNLAAWHLFRLAPDVKGIPFQPNGSKDDFVAAYNGWRAAIPAGTVPKPPAKPK
jgi:hypothetical protein